MAQSQTSNAFPFLDADFTRGFSDFRLPGLDADSLVNAQRRNVEALTQANQRTLEGLQAVLRRQVEFSQHLAEEATGWVNAVMAEGTPEQRMARQAELLRGQVDEALANLRELGDLAQKTNSETAELLAGRIREGLAELEQAAAELQAGGAQSGAQSQSQSQGTVKSGGSSKKSA